MTMMAGEAISPEAQAPAFWPETGSVPCACRSIGKERGARNPPSHRSTMSQKGRSPNVQGVLHRLGCG